MAATPQTGWQCTLATTGVSGKTIAKARDVELNAGSDEADVSSRASSAWEDTLQGLKEWSIKADQVWITSDAGLQALITAYLANTVLAISIVTGAGKGFTGSAFIVDMGHPQPLNGGVMLPVTLQGTGALTPV